VPARKLTPRGEERRRQLLAYATERFATNGYHPTSVAELVEGIGVGKGVFYWYFQSKEELFIELLREGLRDLRRTQRAAVQAETDPVRRIEAGIETALAWWSEHRDLYLLLRFAQTESRFREAVSQSEGVAIRDVTRHVREAMGTGRIPDGDPEVVAQAILGVSAHLARVLLLERNRSHQEVAAATLSFIRSGLRAPGAPCAGSASPARSAARSR
jgi:AcrR family transcriptional regulator